MESIPEFKLVLIGSGGTGKTSFVDRFITGEFKNLHVPTLHVDVHPIIIHTNRGLLKFNVWDTVGQEPNGDIRARCNMQSQCAIIMFDTTDRRSYGNIPIFHRELTRVSPGIPVCLVGNKNESKNRKVKEAEATNRHRNKMKYYGVSVLDMDNIEKPFLWLARQLSGDDHLHYVPEPAPGPPHVYMDEATMRQLHETLLAAAVVPLPFASDGYL